MANYGFLNDPEDEDFTAQASPYINGGGFGGGLLGESRQPRQRGFEPDLGLLGLAAGLMQPTVGGKFATAFSNGLEGWASGIGSQRKLDQMDEEIANSAMKRTGKGLKWGLNPFVGSDNKVYLFNDQGQYKELPIQGKENMFQLDQGNQIMLVPRSRPDQPAAVYPKGLNPEQQREWNPNRYQQSPGENGSTVQIDTSTGKQEVIQNPNAPKAPPVEYTKTITGFDNFEHAIDKYISQLQDRNLTDLGPKKNLGLESTYGDLTMINKDIYGLGVLNAGDKPAIERVLIDPTSPRSVMYSNDELIKQAEDVKRDFQMKRKSLQETYRSSGYRVDQPNTPVRGQVGNVVADFSTRQEAEDYYNSQPDGPEKEALGQILNQTKSPYAVNKSSVPALKKPSASTLDAARAKINEYAGNDQVRSAVIKRLQDAGYDTTGL